MAEQKNDAALLADWHERKDADAFLVLTQRYARVAYAAALRVLGNTADAEDVTQECFEKLASMQGVPANYLGPWIHRVATNRALDQAKSTGRRLAREANYAAGAVAEQEVAWDDVYFLVDAAINRLPEVQRRVIVSHFIEGLTQEAIAQREGVARSTVALRQKEGIASIRATLRKTGVVMPVSLLATLLDHTSPDATMLPEELTARLGHIALSGGALAALERGAPILASSKLLLVAGMSVIIVVIASSITGIQWMHQTSERARINETGALRNAPALAAGEAAPLEAQLPAVNSREEPPMPALAGRVIDAETGEGLVGVQIRVRMEKVRFEVNTDATGEYVFESLRPGTYIVSCHSANGYYLDHDLDIPDRNAARRVTISREHPSVREEFALPRGQGYLGCVVDEQGRPIVGTPVTGVARVNNVPFTNTALSGPGGTFQVTGFPETVNLYVWSEAERLVSKTHGPFMLPQGEAKGENVVLYPESIVRGTVVNGAGAPLAGLRVEPQFVNDEARRRIEAVSDGQGHYELQGMFPGFSLLKVCRDIEIVNSPIPTLELKPGDLVEDLTLVAAIGETILAGRVTDMRGEAIAKATVTVHGPSGQKETRSGPDGAFEVTELEEGAYKVAAQSELHLPEERLDVMAGTSDLGLVLQDAFTVSGRVVDGETGAPIPRCDVKWCPDPRYLFLEHYFVPNDDDEGRFTLRVPQRGRVILAARAEGHLLGHTAIELGDDNPPPDELVLRLIPHGPVRGAVRAADGKPVAGAFIFSGPFRDSDADDFAAARTGTDGAFEIAPEKIAHEQLSVFHRSYSPASVSLDSLQDGDVPLEVVLEAGSALICRVTLGGEPLSGAWFSLEPEPETRPPLTDVNGTSEIRSLPPFEYRVTAGMSIASHPRGMSDQSGMAVIEAGNTTEIAFDFPTGTAALRGTLLGEATFMLLRLDVAGAPSRFIHCDDLREAQGRYAFEELPAGDASLSVTFVPAGGARDVKRQYELTLLDGEETVQDIDFEEEGGDVR
ncbi:MAG: sigma-70 family RNA polymerase sigma factor [Candidatus Hydrogenedentes bacterium]|nr:sigma-70 family RNA polymerase sigma factor [Candidatus Hydrogenedentota bacterium]